MTGCHAEASGAGHVIGGFNDEFVGPGAADVEIGWEVLAGGADGFGGDIGIGQGAAHVDEGV